MVGLVKLVVLCIVTGTSAQSCTDPLPMPTESEQDRDTSGLRPSRWPPIPVGESLQYQCPQMKSIRGKNSFTVECNDEKEYVFPTELLGSWGECQCYQDQRADLTAQCPGLSYTAKYALDWNDRPSIELSISQPKGTSNWKLGIQFDLNIEALHVRTSDASMTLLDSFTIQLMPLSNNDFKAPEKNVTIQYFFNNKEAISSNDKGEIPRWRHVCVTKVTQCEYNNAYGSTGAAIGILVACTVGILIGLLCCCSCCGYCILKASAGSKSGRPNSVSTIEDWTMDYYSNDYRISKRQTLPTATAAEWGEEYDMKTVTPSPRRAAA